MFSTSLLCTAGGDLTTISHKDCGEEIGRKRLEARPVTTLCIDCKTIQESKEKAQGK